MQQPKSKFYSMYVVGNFVKHSGSKNDSGGCFNLIGAAR